MDLPLLAGIELLGDSVFDLYVGDGFGVNLSQITQIFTDFFKTI